MISSSPTVSLVPAGVAKRRGDQVVTLRGIGTAVPEFSATQEEALEFISERFPVAERTRQLYKKTLRNKSIHKRHFGLSNLENVLDQDLDRKNARFEKEAVALSTRSLKSALADAGVRPSQIDFLVVTTCTGYICPGLSAYLIESCGLRPDTRVADLVGMGCGAAVPALEQAHNFLVANPGKTAAVVSTEICSAAMVSNDEIDIVISNTIFADGSAALVLSSNPTPAPSPDGEGNQVFKGEVPSPARGRGRVGVIRGFSSLMVPEWRDTLRFRSEKGHLKNVLGKEVPQQSASAMKKVAEKLLANEGLQMPDISHWMLHAGGEKVLDAMEQALPLPAEALTSSRAVLKDFGNMSSPTVLFVLAEEFRSKAPRVGDWGVLASFGAGFSAHGALIEWI